MRLLRHRRGDERGGPAGARRRTPTRAEVVEALDRNLCRCGAHNRMVRAVAAGGAAMAETGRAAEGPGRQPAAGPVDPGRPGRPDRRAGRQGRARPGHPHRAGPARRRRARRPTWPTCGCCGARHRRRAGRGPDRRQHVDLDLRAGAAGRRGQRARRCSSRPRRATGGSTRATVDRRRRTASPARTDSAARTASWPPTSTWTCRPTRRAGQGRRRAGSPAPTCPGSTCPDKVAGRPALHRTTCGCPASCSAGWSGRRRAAPGCATLDARRWPGRRRRVVRDGSFLGVAGAGRGRGGCARPTRLRGDGRLGRARRAAGRGRPRRASCAPARTRRSTVAADGVNDGAAPAAARPRSRATYRRPFVAHASIAPSCAVARWDAGRRAVEVWSHSQGICKLARAIAAALGLDPATVHVRHAEGAGCYGHNARRRRRLRRGAGGQGRAGHAGAGAVEPAGRAGLGAVRLGDGGRRRGRSSTTAGRLASWRYDVYSQGHSSRPGYAGVPGLLAATTWPTRRRTRPPVDPPTANGGGSTRNALPGYDLPTGGSPGTG